MEENKIYEGKIDVPLKDYSVFECLFLFFEIKIINSLKKQIQLKNKTK